MEWISVHELSKILNTSVKTLQNRISSGSSMPPSYKRGRQRLFKKCEVDIWIEQSREFTSLNEQLSGKHQ